MRRAVFKLPERQRMTVLLRVYEELSHKEIAEIMGCPVGRFLWPRHAVRPEDVEAIERELPLAEEDLAKALDFWKCLCVSAPGTKMPEELRRKAHRRMKQLHERFHREYLEGKRS